jgi:hypothetical protein
MCGPPLDRFTFPSYFSSRQSKNQNVSNFVSFCTRNSYSLLSLSVSILSLPYLLVNYFRLSNSLHPLFFVFFHYLFFRLPPLFPIIFSFQGHRKQFRTPLKENIWDTPSRADWITIKKMQRIWAPDSIQDCRSPVICTGFPPSLRHCHFHSVPLLSFIHLCLLFVS